MSSDENIKNQIKKNCKANALTISSNNKTKIFIRFVYQNAFNFVFRQGILGYT